jgi:hypothetical protein
MIEFLLSWITTPQYLWSFMTYLSFISFMFVIFLSFVIIIYIKEMIEQWNELKKKKEVKNK